MNWKDLIRRVEPRALLLLFAIVGAVWAFLSIGGEIAEGESLGFDRQMLLALRTPGDLNDPIGGRGFEEAMRDVTALGGFTLLTLFTVIAVLTFLAHGKRLHAAILTVAVLGAQFTGSNLKHIYGRPRPDVVPHGVYVYSGSFPSGHSLMSAATYLTLAVLLASLESRRSVKLTFFALAVLLMGAIGFSRVYLGVHWPSDVLGGWCAGAAWAMAAWIALRQFAKRQDQPKP
ncbi:phosphatase PAP2 family protein [Phenylobacterium immobile]|uniref:phosphatase PAP2 family protein n=1 Tax=Phenylobacterium immobile TaxID=21 RepID=UPI000A503110|nr:phosphatase PAP2 family protein [Phenylobacterium immobile]